MSVHVVVCVCVCVCVRRRYISDTCVTATIRAGWRRKIQKFDPALIRYSWVPCTHCVPNIYGTDATGARHFSNRNIVANIVARNQHVVSS